MMSISVEIGHNITRLRKQKRMSQEYLALYSDMSVSYLRTIEHGVANPTIGALSRIAATLNEPFSSLVAVEEDDADEKE